MGTSAAHEITPERFGRYVLLDRIGVGGMAEVFRAGMPGVQGFQRTFVVKRIIAERAQSPYFVEMFVQEARINAILRDRARPCPVGVAAFNTHEVAQALAYAHALATPDGAPLNLVHRDVSPSNTICQRAGGVKLLDFGIAKTLGEPEVEKTGQRMCKGKLCYVAPERIKDRPADGRSDLFSLGACFWALLVGRKLFRGKDDLETLHNVVDLAVPRPGGPGAVLQQEAKVRRQPTAPTGHGTWSD